MVTAAITDRTGIQWACSGSSGDRKTRTNAPNAAAFTPVDMNAVTIVGAPSYASGVHMWNGTAVILKAKPTASSPTVSSATGLGVAVGYDNAMADSSIRVEPDNKKANATPYRKNVLENAPSRKYLSAASAPEALCRRMPVRT